MKLKTLVILFVWLSLLSSNAASDGNKPSKTTTGQVSKPNYEVAIQFINDYLNYSNTLKSEIGLIEWVNKRNDVTVRFKDELKITKLDKKTAYIPTCLVCRQSHHQSNQDKCIVPLF